VPEQDSTAIRVCRICGVEKSLELFKKGNPGIDKICKACDALRARERHAKRGGDAKRSIAYYHKHRERIIAKLKTNPKQKIRQQVHDAVSTGRLIKPNNCEACGKVCNPHGHHRDYSKPLEVVWLCRACHFKEHRKYPERGAPLEAKGARE
jgi:hypothetical protein